jgi:peptidoglycan/xylan/chitin deacetylase (PgdA/CDA1 family)
LPELIHHGPETGPQVALTFDDGPRPGVTDRILDELQHRGLHATFFMIGREVNAAPDLARRVLAEGHTIANHSLTHPRLSDLPNAQATHEIQRAQDIFADVLGVRPIWFRPPYGALRPDQHEMVRGLGLRTVMWNVDPGDWAQPGEDKIISTILRETQAGAIILCHDRHPQTANAIGVILDGLLERGFRPVTLSVLME